MSFPYSKRNIAQWEADFSTDIASGQWAITNTQAENFVNSSIHLVLSSDDNYARYLAVTIVSVLANRADGDTLFFHILDGGIRQENRDIIARLVTDHGDIIEFLTVDQSLFSGKMLNISEQNHITLATYYRLLTPSLIKANRCIYMDCDMICRSSLAPVWHTELDGKLAAAVLDISDEELAPRLGVKKYFNAGFFLFDLKTMREEGVQERFFRFIEEQHNRILMHDQDVLNAVLEDRIFELDKRWNCQVCKTRACKKKGFHALSHSASVLHYLGHRKPWVKGCRAPGRELYWKYLEMTPWKMSAAEKIRFQIGDLWKRMQMIFK